MRSEHLGDPVEQLDGHGVAEGVEEAFADEGADDADPAAAQRRRDRVRARVAQLGGRSEDALRVAGATRGLPAKVSDAVDGETPARAATAARVGRPAAGGR